MRMWMVDPSQMCRKHLLGEHVECHMFFGTLMKKKSIDGYIRNNCLELGALKSRHNALANEMAARGYNHQTPMEKLPDFSYLDRSIVEYQVKCVDAEADLRSRCDQCFHPERW